MSILDRMRARLEDIAAAGLPALGAGEDRLAFSAEIPAGVFGSILKLNVSVENETHGDGERVRVRAHVQTNFASVLRPMLAAPPPPPKPRKRRGKQSTSSALAPMGLLGQMAQRAQRGVRLAMNSPVVQRMAESVLKNDINTWIEVTASTASLDLGAHALIPQSEKLASLGIRPARHDGPHVESWSGATPTGTAQVSTLQLDKKSLPENLRRKLGDQPFSLAAMIVNTIDEK